MKILIETKLAKPLPCPFCGESIDLVEVHHKLRKSDLVVAVACRRCGARGPEVHPKLIGTKEYYKRLDRDEPIANQSLKEAVDSWNNRK